MRTRKDRTRRDHRTRHPASTKPRSCERGKKAEKANAGLEQEASTKPRSCERGKAASLRGTGQGSYASTKPRSCERGKIRRSKAHHSGWLSFNEAAFMRTRKAEAFKDKARAIEIASTK